MCGAEKTVRNGLESWWRDGHVHRSRSLHLKTKCHRVVSHVFGTAMVTEFARQCEIRRMLALFTLVF